MANLPSEHDLSNSFCPFLGAVTDGGEANSPIDYPSFENRCLVSERREGLMLTDQATFCLSRGHRYCPRFVANRATLAHHVNDGTVGHFDQPVGNSMRAPHQTGKQSLRSRGQSPSNSAHSFEHAGTHIELETTPRSDSALNSSLFTDSMQDIEEEIRNGFHEQATRGRRWGWFGAALIFLMSLMCGGASAAYIGWQLVNSNLIAMPPGELDLLVSNPTPALPQIYFVVTATTDPLSVLQSQPNPAAIAQTYPQAVTPTPLMLGAAVQPSVSIQSQPEQSSATIPQLAQSQANLVGAETPPPATSAIISNIDLQVPTRRPTPEFDLPTSTVGPPVETPTATATPIIFLGPPVVIFSADDSSLLTGKCTTVSWNVQNVREVYYENLGVDGQGEREECVDDRDGEYTLTVVLQDGSTRTYTATVDMLQPTNTPAPTASFTPKPEATATWTPVVPTDTPTPDLQYGVRIAIDGDEEVTCSAGATCEFGLLVTNTSKVVDTLTVVFSERSSWSSRFCRMDGVCSESELSLVNVGPSNTAFVQLVVQVPSESDQSSAKFGAMALSEGSNRTKSSSPVSITVVRSTEGE